MEVEVNPPVIEFTEDTIIKKTRFIINANARGTSLSNIREYPFSVRIFNPPAEIGDSTQISLNTLSCAGIGEIIAEPPAPPNKNSHPLLGNVIELTSGNYLRVMDVKRSLLEADINNMANKYSEVKVLFVDGCTIYDVKTLVASLQVKAGLRDSATPPYKWSSMYDIYGILERWSLPFEATIGIVVITDADKMAKALSSDFYKLLFIFRDINGLAQGTQFYLILQAGDITSLRAALTQFDELLGAY